jgi:uncharacterized protein GlcG (DUF336 family)
VLTLKGPDCAYGRILVEGRSNGATVIAVPMCIYVTDESRNQIAFQRMDGGKVTSTTIAIDMAYTASAAMTAAARFLDELAKLDRPRAVIAHGPGRSCGWHRGPAGC